MQFLDGLRARQLVAVDDQLLVGGEVEVVVDVVGRVDRPLLDPLHEPGVNVEGEFDAALAVDLDAEHVPRGLELVDVSLQEEGAVPVEQVEVLVEPFLGGVAVDPAPRVVVGAGERDDLAAEVGEEGARRRHHGLGVANPLDYALDGVILPGRQETADQGDGQDESGQVAPGCHAESPCVWLPCGHRRAESDPSFGRSVPIAVAASRGGVTGGNQADAPHVPVRGRLQLVQQATAKLLFKHISPGGVGDADPQHAILAALRGTHPGDVGPDQFGPLPGQAVEQESSLAVEFVEHLLHQIRGLPGGSPQFGHLVGSKHPTEPIPQQAFALELAVAGAPLLMRAIGIVTTLEPVGRLGLTGIRLHLVPDGRSPACLWLLPGRAGLMVCHYSVDR